MSSKRTVFDDFLVDFDTSVRLVCDVLLVGADDAEECVRMVDVGDVTRRNSVPIAWLGVSSARAYQSELSQCSKPIIRTLAETHTRNTFDKEIYHSSLVVGIEVPDDQFRHSVMMFR